MEDKRAGEEAEHVVMEKRQRVNWLDLPRELWTLIAKHLEIDNNATFEIRRFRSVCKTWRSALPLPYRAPFAPQVYIPLGRGKCISHLLQTKIYRLEPLPHQPRTDEDTSTYSTKGWIIMVGESQSAPLRLLNPLSGCPQTHKKNASPKVLNLVNFRVVELVEAFTIQDYGLESVDYYLRKVVMLPSFPDKGPMMCGLCFSGKLHVRISDQDKNWSIMDLDYDDKARYHDIIIHKGHVYVLNREGGTIFWIDPSSLKLVQYSPSLYRGYCIRKEMVECNGSLYVVDIRHIQEQNFEACIEVHKLDEEWPRWENVKNLGDFLFVLGNDFNFSLSAQDYYGCKGNCIYFAYNNKILCFNLEDSKLKLPNPFWPCPTLFNPEFNL